MAPKSAAAFLLLGLFVAAGCDDDGPICPSHDAGSICTLMGTGQKGYTGEAALPRETALYYPTDLDYDGEGRLLVMDWNNLRVRRLDHDGRVRTIVGTGTEEENFVVNGTPALETPLHHPFSMALDGVGDLFLAESHAPQVLRVDPQLLAWVAAGTLSSGYSGDGGPALDAMLDTPSGVAVAPEGFPIYIADTANHCLRRVDADGTIRTIAGNGHPGYSGDGGQAGAALLHSPYRVRLNARNGDIYIADTENHCIRRIDGAGIITTVAGFGAPGDTGDGGPATLAMLHSPYDARVGPDGFLYIADTENHRVRRVDASGVITTVAGTGTSGFRGDGGPAARAELAHPFALAFDPDGNLIVADTYNSVVRRVERP